MRPYILLGPDSPTRSLYPSDMSVAASSSRIGIFCIIAGMFCISLNDMLIKTLAADYALHQLMLMRSVIALCFSAALLRAEGGFALLHTGRWFLHGLRAVFVLIANSAFFLAIVMMPLATATALYFVAPLFVTLLSIPILGEDVGPRRFAAIFVGFVGVLIIMAPQLGTQDHALGWVAVLPVIAAAFYASMSVLTRVLGQGTKASALAIHIQLSFVLFSTLVYVFAGNGQFYDPEAHASLQFLFRPWVWPAGADVWPIVGLGVLSGGIGYLMSQAYRLSSASVVAPFEYVLLIFSLFWGWTIFSEWPQPMVLLGAAIVIASGFYIFLREGGTAPPKRA